MFWFMSESKLTINALQIGIKKDPSLRRFYDTVHFGEGELWLNKNIRAAKSLTKNNELILIGKMTHWKKPFHCR